MIRPLFTASSSSFGPRTFSRRYLHRACLVAGGCSLLIASGLAFGQAITIDTHTGANKGNGGTVDRRYAQIQPTNVALTQSELDAKTRQELIRVLQSEQGFAMRPFPMGHKGLTLEANGKLNPAGEAYLDMATQFGLSAKPGDRVVLSDVTIEHNKIVFDLNGGPDLKHRFLRHVQLGAGNVGNPVVQDDGQKATGARLTLEFKGHIPELTGKDVKALLAPLISFDVKTPIQAFTDTLPPKLKAAILDHNVLVGMSTDMVLFAMGQPLRKIREVEGQMPFEEWIYGSVPEPVQFVRINGNRVIRVEIAKVGEALVIFTKDEVEGLMRSDGSPVVAENQHTRTVKMGDVERDPNTQAPAPPPTLTAPGEKLPEQANTGAGTMKPVQFPTQKPEDYPDATNLPRDHKPADNPDDPDAPPKPASTTQPDTAKPAPPSPTTQPPAASSAPPPQSSTPN